MRSSNLRTAIDGHRVVLAGRFDVHEVTGVARALDSVAAPRLEIDMQSVCFVDAPALELLEGHAARRAEEGRSVAITRASPAASTIIAFAQRAGMIDGLAVQPVDVALAVAA